MKVGVLILDSVDDSITRQRHRILTASPQLQDYRIEYCYALDIDDSEIDLDAMEILRRKKLDPDELFAKLDERLATGDFRCVLVHTGFVFGSHTNAYYYVFGRLRQAYPDVGVAFEKRPGLDIHPSCVDSRPWTKALHDLFFVEVFGRRRS